MATILIVEDALGMDAVLALAKPALVIPDLMRRNLDAANPAAHLITAVRNGGCLLIAHVTPTS